MSNNLQIVMLLLLYILVLHHLWITKTTELNQFQMISVENSQVPYSFGLSVCFNLIPMIRLCSLDTMKQVLKNQYNDYDLYNYEKVFKSFSCIFDDEMQPNCTAQLLLSHFSPKLVLRAARICDASQLISVNMLIESLVIDHKEENRRKMPELQNSFRLQVNRQERFLFFGKYCVRYVFNDEVFTQYRFEISTIARFWYADKIYYYLHPKHQFPSEYKMQRFFEQICCQSINNQIKLHVHRYSSNLRACYAEDDHWTPLHCYQSCMRNHSNVFTNLFIDSQNISTGSSVTFEKFKRNFIYNQSIEVHQPSASLSIDHRKRKDYCMQRCYRPACLHFTMENDLFSNYYESNIEKQFRILFTFDEYIEKWHWKPSFNWFWISTQYLCAFWCIFGEYLHMNRDSLHQNQPQNLQSYKITSLILYDKFEMQGKRLWRNLLSLKRMVVRSFQSTTHTHALHSFAIRNNSPTDGASIENALLWRHRILKLMIVIKNRKYHAFIVRLLGLLAFGLLYLDQAPKFNQTNEMKLKSFFMLKKFSLNLCFEVTNVDNNSKNVLTPIILTEQWFENNATLIYTNNLQLFKSKSFVELLNQNRKNDSGPLLSWFDDCWQHVQTWLGKYVFWTFDWNWQDDEESTSAYKETPFFIDYSYCIQITLNFNRPQLEKLIRLYFEATNGITLVTFKPIARMYITKYDVMISSDNDPDLATNFNFELIFHREHAIHGYQYCRFYSYIPQPILHKHDLYNDDYCHSTSECVSRCLTSHCLHDLESWPDCAPITRSLLSKFSKTGELNLISCDGSTDALLTKCNHIYNQFDCTEEYFENLALSSNHKNVGFFHSQHIPWKLLVNESSLYEILSVAMLKFNVLIIVATFTGLSPIRCVVTLLSFCNAIFCQIFGLLKIFSSVSSSRNPADIVQRQPPTDSAAALPMKSPQTGWQAKVAFTCYKLCAYVLYAICAYLCFTQWILIEKYEEETYRQGVMDRTFSWQRFPSITFCSPLNFSKDWPGLSKMKAQSVREIIRRYDSGWLLSEWISKIVLPIVQDRNRFVILSKFELKRLERELHFDLVTIQSWFFNWRICHQLHFNYNESDVWIGWLNEHLIQFEIYESRWEDVGFHLSAHGLYPFHQENPFNDVYEYKIIFNLDETDLQYTDDFDFIVSQVHRRCPKARNKKVLHLRLQEMYVHESNLICANRSHFSTDEDIVGLANCISNQSSFVTSILPIPFRYFAHPINTALFNEIQGYLLKQVEESEEYSDSMSCPIQFETRRTKRQFLNLNLNLFSLKFEQKGQFYFKSKIKRDLCGQLLTFGGGLGLWLGIHLTTWLRFVFMSISQLPSVIPFI